MCYFRLYVVRKFAFLEGCASLLLLLLLFLLLLLLARRTFVTQEAVRGVACTHDSTLFIVSHGAEKHKVCVYELDSGALLRTMGGPDKGTEPGLFNAPMGVCVTPGACVKGSKRVRA